MNMAILRCTTCGSVEVFCLCCASSLGWEQHPPALLPGAAAPVGQHQRALHPADGHVRLLREGRGGLQRIHGPGGHPPPLPRPRAEGPRGHRGEGGDPDTQGREDESAPFRVFKNCPRSVTVLHLPFCCIAFCTLTSLRSFWKLECRTRTLAGPWPALRLLAN